MSNEEIHPVVVIQGHPCMGCGAVGRICLELGLKDNNLTLACRTCTNMIYDRAEGAMNTSTQPEQEVEYLDDQDLSEPNTIRVEVDTNQDDTPPEI